MEHTWQIVSLELKLGWWEVKDREVRTLNTAKDFYNQTVWSLTSKISLQL